MRYENFDISIIGGGPAGSACGNYLAGIGYNICIIEKKSFPREVICGEFLSNEVIESLKELYIYNEFLFLNPNPIKSFRLILNNNSEYKAKLGFNAYSISRSIFDNFLLNKAKHKNIQIFQPAEVNKIIRGKDNFTISIKGKENDNLLINSRVLISAYGKQNILDKNLSRSFIRIKSGINGVKFHIPRSYLKNINKEEVQMYSSQGIYCGLNAIDNDLINLCYLAKMNYSHKAQRDFLINFISKNNYLGDMFYSGYKEIIKLLPVWGAGNIYFGKKRAVENGIFMVGDSAGMIAPFTGDGIGMAFQSSKLAASLIVDLLKGRISNNESENKYYLEWNKLFNRRINISLFLQKLILNKVYRKAGEILLDMHPGFLPAIIRITRG